MNLLGLGSAMDSVAWRGVVITGFLLNFVFACQLLLLQPLVSALDGKPGDAAELFQKVSQNVKVKRFNEALDDLNSAIEADPMLSEAYRHRASVHRQLCRLPLTKTFCIICLEDQPVKWMFKYSWYIWKINGSSGC